VPLAEDDTSTLKEFERFPTGWLITDTVKLPADRMAVPTNCVEVALDNALTGIEHVVNWLHPAPLKETDAPLGSKPVPVIVNVKACPADGGFGDVVMPVSIGVKVVEVVETVSEVVPFDVAPLAVFCTLTENAPAVVSVVVPLKAVEVFEVNALVETTHPAVAHPGPTRITVALATSKPVPVTVNENACPASGGFGEVVIPLITGVALVSGFVTVTDKELEGDPFGPF
jgi:hypothetical protein